MSIIQICFDLLYVRAKPHAVRSEAAERPEMDWFLTENNLYIINFSPYLSRFSLFGIRVSALEPDIFPLHFGVNSSDLHRALPAACWHEDAPFLVLGFVILQCKSSV